MFLLILIKLSHLINVSSFLRPLRYYCVIVSIKVVFQNKVYSITLNCVRYGCWCGMKVLFSLKYRPPRPKIRL